MVFYTTGATSRNLPRCQLVVLAQVRHSLGAPVSSRNLLFNSVVLLRICGLGSGISHRLYSRDQVIHCSDNNSRIGQTIVTNSERVLMDNSRWSPD